MRPSATEYARAIELGEQARRAAKPATSNPYNDSTDHGRLLHEAWARGHERQDEQRRRR